MVGGMLFVEGLHDLEGKIENLEVLHAAGFRMAGLTHFFDNDIAGSMHGLKKGGLTPLGRQVVARMEALGMIVDLAHSSHAIIADVLAIATRPVISSHGGVLGTCKINRNLSDDEIRGIAKTGGVIGIGYFKGAICSTNPKDIARAIAHVRDVVGIDYVGLGLRFRWLDRGFLRCQSGGRRDAGTAGCGLFGARHSQGHRRQRASRVARRDCTGEALASAGTHKSADVSF